jgi:cytochrome b6-f complex iron-sulfur subunit
MDRRDFIKTACLAGGIAGMGSLVSTLPSCTKVVTSSDFTIDLTDPTYAALAHVGGNVTVNNGSYNIIVVRETTSTYKAVSNQCTHQSCTVAYNSTIDGFLCPCHGGQFDIDGRVVAGPPTVALTKFNVSVSGTTMTITS